MVQQLLATLFAFPALAQDSHPVVNDHSAVHKVPGVNGRMVKNSNLLKTKNICWCVSMKNNQVARVLAYPRRAVRRCPTRSHIPGIQALYRSRADRAQRLHSSSAT